MLHVFYGVISWALYVQIALVHRSTAHILERILTVDLIMPVSMPEGAVRFRDFEGILKVLEGLEFSPNFVLIQMIQGVCLICHGVIAKMILLLQEATFTKALERTLTSGQLL